MHTSFKKTIAHVLLQAMLYQLIAPAGELLALTSGPSQPEFSSFEPVGTDGMVNPLTGQFTYNLPVLSIPGPNGSGYALSLSYHSGASPEEEASWVGYGWTLNPGSVNRMKRGFPDDYNGDEVRYWNRTVPNWTVTAGFKANVEIFSQQPFGLTGSIRYNNYKGFGYAAGISTAVKGLGSLSFSVSDAGVGFTPDIRPAELLGELGLMGRVPADASFLASTLHGVGTKYLELLATRADRYAMYSVANEIRPTNFAPYRGTSFNVTVEGLFPAGSLPLGPNGGLFGSYTIQHPANGGLNVLKAYGYMYSADAKNEPKGMMDYYVEKDAPYTKRDRFLSIPFSNADLFSVTGQGLGGGFRLYNSRPGQFRPNKAESETTIGNLEFQGHLGPLNFGIGAGIGVGKQFLTINPWLDEGATYSFAGREEGDEPYFFRMNNDRGGSVLFDDDDDARQALPANGGGIWGFESYDASLAGAGIHTLNSGKRSGRSTYIGYSTIQDILDAPSRGQGIYPSFQAHDNTGAHGYRYFDTKSRLAEFSLTNAEGKKYVYGLPVYSRKEKNLQYGLNELNVKEIQDRHLAYANVTPPNSDVVVGEERDGHYASTYLLSSITTADYIDRTMNGPSYDDFGGYTTFNYSRTAGERVDYTTLNYNPAPGGGGNGSVTAQVRRFDSKTDPIGWTDPTKKDESSWYRWRVPYRGLLYQPNTLSDDKDDMGGMSMGEREVYYLSTVETKTHCAVFVTNAGITTHGKFFPGSGVHRKDGYEAVHHEYDVTGNKLATRAANGAAQAPNQLRRLERIELWSMNPDGTLKDQIQTVHFEYDYSICRGLPNAFKESGETLSNGKLTLKRVYFEYGGVSQAKIAPYVFGYNYRTQSAGNYTGLPSEVQTKYDSILDYGDTWTAAAQNPDYEPFQVGRWGFYQYDGKNRHQRMNPWEDQTPGASFDPAAWQLKWIRLPSGGEIQIQYEQNDYAYVQNRVAMAMVPLLGADLNADKYYLNLDSALNIAPGTDNEKKMVEAIRSLFVEKGEKLFFRTLNSLDGSSANIATVENGRQEFIKGYAKIEEVGIETSGAFLGKVFVRMGSGNNATPGDAARVFANRMRAGIVGKPGLHNKDDAKSNVMSILGKVGDQFETGNGSVIDWDDSYVRVPLGKPGQIVRAKKGGGFRVRRLLLYDPGLEGGGGGLYGAEYLYRNEDNTSSGVASNEPTEGREESALVRLLDRRLDQEWLERVISGTDRAQFEGPLGESLLPGPSVTFSRVVVQSIHTGKTNPGFTINEYYTSKDFPFQCIYGPEDVKDANVTPIERRTDLMTIPAPYFSYNKSNIWATQGYRFVLNDMAGQLKKTASYGGDYTAPATDWVETSMQEYTYFTPGEKVPMLYDYTTQPTYRMEDPGKEMEVTFEGRSVDDIGVDVAGHIDASICIIPMFPFPLIFPVTSLGGNISYSESKLKTHVACKVVRYPAIIKQIASRQDGISNLVENVGFNPLTGDPIVTRMGDAYTGVTTQFGGGGSNQPHNRSYKAFSYPAAMEYTAMGQKAHNERATILTEAGKLSIDKRFDGGKHYLAFKYLDAGRVCRVSDLLGPGDLIDVFTTTNGRYDGNRSIGVFHVESASGNRVVILPHSGAIPTDWMQGVSVRVLRSGRTNQLIVPRAGITVYTQD